MRLREKPPTIHELNALWEAYRELRYCRAPHDGLGGGTPADAIKDVKPRPLDPEVVRELFLVTETRTVHKKDACVSVEGRRFLCESFLRGEKVKVRFDPNDLGSVLIFFEGKRVQRALPQPVNATPEPHTAPVERARSSVDYLALVREDYDRKLVLDARPLAYRDLRVEPGFDRDRFLEVIAGLAGVTLRAPARAELSAFWDSFGPLPEDLVRIGAEHAVRLHGRGRHVRVYLHAVRTLVLAHWRGPPEEKTP